MIGLLVRKDLRRARANPWPYVFYLALPLCVTALVGLIFGPSRSKDTGIGPVKIAIVDEDDSYIGRFVRSALNSGEAQKHIEPRFLDRAEALAQIQDNQLSAVILIPPNFTTAFLAAEEVPPLELVKNPTQSFLPAIVEELLQVVVEVLNAAARIVGDDLAEWKTLMEKEGAPDMQTMAKLMVRLGEKFESAEDYLFPPLLGYTQEVREDRDAEDSPGISVFAFLLPGLASMFLFFMADGALRDFYGEMRKGTLNRIRTTPLKLGTFIGAKVLFAVIIVLLGATILFGGGSLLFGFRWERPVPLALVVFSFACFAAAFMALIASLAGSEKRADVLNVMLIMGISFMGGSFFPARELPGFIRDTISPWLPNYWFIEAVRDLQSSQPQMSWSIVALGFGFGAIVLVSVAAKLLNHLLRKQSTP